jgi:general secretion pathway protein G
VSLLFATGCSQHRKEELLKEQLYTMRNAIDRYSERKSAAPQSLGDLVRDGYLREIPVDPFTKSNRRWQIIREDVLNNKNRTAPGIVDVHSGSDLISSEGTPYSGW